MISEPISNPNDETEFIPLKSSKLEMKKPIFPYEKGVKLIHNPVYNKGTAFSKKER